VSLLDSWIQFWHTACPDLAAAQLRKQHQQQQGQRQRIPDPEAAAAAAAEAAGRVMLCYGMLSDNYRSHVRLLDLPSRLFYGGALRACAPPAAVAPPHWSELMVHGADTAPAAAAAANAANSTAAAAGGPEGSVGQDAGSEAAGAAAGDGAAGGDDEVLGSSSMLFVGVNGEQRQVCACVIKITQHVQCL
jgi:hypothetical protein